MSVSFACKKMFLFLFCGVFCLWAGLSQAQDIDVCDYDDMMIGSGTIENIEGVFTLDFSDMGGNGIRREIAANHPIIAMFQDAAKHAELDPETGVKEFAVLMSLNEPVCAVNFQKRTLFFGQYVEKDAYYAVSVCVPETSHCWIMKINKNSALGGEIRAYGIERAPSELSVVISTGDVILTTYAP